MKNPANLTIGKGAALVLITAVLGLLGGLIWVEIAANNHPADELGNLVYLPCGGGLIFLGVLLVGLVVLHRSISA